MAAATTWRWCSAPASAVDALGEATAEIAATDLGFGAAAVVRARSGRWAGSALVFLSRTHYYEGKGVAAVVHGVRTAAERAAAPGGAHRRLRRPEGDVDAGAQY